MDRLPLELVAEIAALLPLDSVRNFRLASTWLATATFSTLAPHLGVLNIAESWQYFKKYITEDRTKARQITRLTIYHAGWANHMFSGDDADLWDVHHRDRELMKWRPLAEPLITSRPDLIVPTLRAIIEMLPSLTHITIQHIDRLRRIGDQRYLRLVQMVHYPPFRRDSIKPTTRSALLALTTSRATRVSALQIVGPWRHEENRPYGLYPPLTKLAITSLETVELKMLHAFCWGFTELTDLTLGLVRQDFRPLRLGSLNLPRLKNLELQRCRVQERTMTDFVRRHKSLLLICARQVRLVRGNWQEIQARWSRLAVIVDNSELPAGYQTSLL